MMLGMQRVRVMKRSREMRRGRRIPLLSPNRKRCEDLYIIKVVGAAIVVVSMRPK